MPLSSKINISKRYVASDVPNGTFTVALTALASSTSKSNVAGSNTTQFPAWLSATTSIDCYPIPSLKI